MNDRNYKWMVWAPFQSLLPIGKRVYQKVFFVRMEKQCGIIIAVLLLLVVVVNAGNAVDSPSIVMKREGKRC